MTGKNKANRRSATTQKATTLWGHKKRHTFFRIRCLPNEVELEDLPVMIGALFELDSSNINVYSLAADVEGKTATISFDAIPNVFKERNNELGSREVILPYHGVQSPESIPLKFDTHFGGFTPLSPNQIESHKLVCVFLHGWGGHAVGSFRSQNDSHVWPRDSLPRKIPEMQIWTYGYGTRLTDATSIGDSFAYAEDLKAHLHLLIKRISIQQPSMPIIFVAHSLGGLMLQRAMVSMYKSCDPDDERLLQSICAVLFFGVPGNGMDVTALSDLVRGTPHEFELALLDQKHGHQFRINEQEDFHHTFQRAGADIFNFWERKKTKTLIKDCETGKYKRNGPEKLLVPPTQMLHGQDENRQRLRKPHFFDRDHFDLVKFSKFDTDCEIVLAILQKYASEATEEKVMVKVGSTRPPAFKMLQHDRIACLQSLHFSGMADRSEEISAAVDTTCRWIFEFPAYVEWSNQSRGLLWIKGKPGAGKSTIMKHILKTVTESPQPSEVRAAFFCHGRGAMMQKNPLGLFRSVLYELARQIPELLDLITQKYVEKCENCGTFGTKWTWTLAELKDMFRIHVVDMAATTVIRIFIDALDECGEQEAVALIGFFKGIEKHLSICFSCRYYPIISLDDSGCEVGVQDNNSDDIAVYLDRRLQDSIPNSQLHTYQEIRMNILEKASGVFQWVKLVTDIVDQYARRGKDPKTIKKKIKDLPPELEDLYHELLWTVDDIDKPQTLKLMQWIYFARRPLTIEELRMALAIDSNMPSDHLQQCKESEYYSKNEFILRTYVLDLSRGLVEIVDRRRQALPDRGLNRSRDVQEVQFIHQSVTDYLRGRGLQLLHNDGGWAPEGSIAGRSQFRLSRSCIRYILADEIQNYDFTDLVRAHERPTVGLLRSKIHEEFPFLSYAASEWVYHCQQAENEEIQQDDLISIWHENPPIISNPNSEIFVHTYQDGMWHFILPRLRKLETLACEFKLTSVLTSMLLQGFDVDLMDLLSSAAQYGHVDIAKIILKQSLLSPNGPYLRIESALATAVRAGREAVAELLLQQPNVDRQSKSPDGRTPLSLAAGSGLQNVVRALLEDSNCNDQDWKDSEGRTPLSRVAGSGHDNILKLFLAQDCVDVNSRDNMGRTPFSWAALPDDCLFKNPQLRVLQTLLTQDGVEKDLRDDSGRTPLSWAAVGDNENVVKTLLDQFCIEKDSKDDTGRTPFSWAAEFGTENVVKVLLDQDDIDKNSQDNAGRSPLSYAVASNGREEVVKVLLNNDDVDAGSKDKDNRSVFFYACRHGDEAVARLLANRGDVDVSLALRLGDPLTQEILSNEKKKLKASKTQRAVRKGRPNQLVSLIPEIRPRFPEV